MRYNKEVSTKLATKINNIIKDAMDTHQGPVYMKRSKEVAELLAAAGVTHVEFTQKDFSKAEESFIFFAKRFLAAKGVKFEMANT
jgi:hypothetical protein